MKNKYQHVISDEAWAEAIERHEKNFQKELEEVDVKEVTLKTKKTVLELGRKVHSTESHLTDAVYDLKDAKNKISNLENKVNHLERQLLKQKDVLEKSLLIMTDLERQLEKIRTKKNVITKFKEFVGWMIK